MLRIGQFTDTFLPVVDGVGRVAVAYAETLSALGHQVSVVTPMYNTGFRGGFPYEIVDFNGMSVPGMRQYRTGEAPWDPHYRKRMRMVKLDILHAHSPFTAGSEALRLAAKRNLPIVGTFHSQYYDDFYKVTKSKNLASLGSKFVVDFYERCDEVWAVGENTAKVLQSYGYRGEVIVMPNGTNIRQPEEKNMCKAVSKYDIPENLPVLLFAGQLNWKKNILCILEACALLQTSGFSFLLLLAGQGPDQAQISRKIAELKLENAVRLIGHVSDSDILDGLYQRAQLFVFPSLYDAAPMVVREAAVMGTPSVMVRGSCAAEVIQDRENGFLCENDPEDLKRVILSALEDRETLDKIGRQASATIPIKWSDILQTAVQRYENLVLKNERGELKKKTIRVI